MIRLCNAAHSKHAAPVSTVPHDETQDFCLFKGCICIVTSVCVVAIVDDMLGQNMGGKKGLLSAKCFFGGGAVIVWNKN